MEIYSNMTEVSTNQNLNAHYTTSAKAPRKTGVVAQPPASVPPQRKVYSDAEANKKFKELNQDLYQDSKKAAKKDKIKLLKLIGIILGAALGVAGIRKLAGFFKKS